MIFNNPQFILSPPKQQPVAIVQKISQDQNRIGPNIMEDTALADSLVKKASGSGLPSINKMALKLIKLVEPIVENEKLLKIMSLSEQPKIVSPELKLTTVNSNSNNGIKNNLLFPSSSSPLKSRFYLVEGLSQPLPRKNNPNSNKENTVIASIINSNKALIRKSKRLKDSHTEAECNNLIMELNKGNNNPGIGTKRVSRTGLLEAQGKNGARVYFAQGKSGKIIIVGKSNKHNQQKVIDILKSMGY